MAIANHIKYVEMSVSCNFSFSQILRISVSLFILNYRDCVIVHTKEYAARHTCYCNVFVMLLFLFSCATDINQNSQSLLHPCHCTH